LYSSWRTDRWPPLILAGPWVGGLGTDLTQDGPDGEAKAHMGRRNIIGQGKGRTRCRRRGFGVPGFQNSRLLMQKSKAFNVDLDYGIASK